MSRDADRDGEDCRVFETGVIPEQECLRHLSVDTSSSLIDDAIIIQRTKFSMSHLRLAAPP